MTERRVLISIIGDFFERIRRREGKHTILVACEDYLKIIEVLRWYDVKCSSSSKSCGLAVEHSAHYQKVVGSIPVQC